MDPISPSANQSEFLKKWKPPSTFSTLILAIEILTSLSKLQAQFVHDFWKFVKGSDVSRDDLLDECEKYEIGTLTFPENLQNVLSTTVSEDNPSASAQCPPLLSVAGFEEPDNFDSGNFSGELVGATSGHDAVDGAAFSCVGQVSAPYTSGKSKSPQEKSKRKSSSGPSPNDKKRTNSVIGESSPFLPEAEIIEPDAEVEPVSNSQNHDNTDSEQATAQSSGRFQYSTLSKMKTQEKDKWLVKNILDALQREHDLLDQERKCSLCKVRQRDTTFLPCGHFLSCKECSEPVFTCPTCDKDILATAQTFLS